MGLLLLFMGIYIGGEVNHLAHPQIERLMKRTIQGAL